MAHDPRVDDLGFARLDLDRLSRTGAPEVVFASHKSPEQTLSALTRLAAAHPDRAVLATRCPAAVLTVARRIDGARVNDVGATVVLGPEPEPHGRVAVVAAGTSDLPVAQEAVTCLQVHGVGSDLIVDVGVAGLHRLLAERERIAAADAVIAVAGMDGALPGVVAGIVTCPVVAVPTSVGYGASLGGIAALLTMLNACAPGVTVVNIDNGFGAAAAVARMLPAIRMSIALWVDATHGAAGDMLLGALLDAGADLEAVRAALARLGTEPVSVQAEPVRRHGLRATHAVVRAAASTARRGPIEIAELLTAAALPPVVDAFSRAVFDRLASAEARVHGVDVAEIHFHEIGALDSMADVVGCAVALDSLGLLGDGVTRRVSTVAVGGGTVSTEHGRLPVPVPAALELLTRAGAPIGAGPGDRELCTPTGAALLATLATDWGGLPDLVVRRYGNGAGTADPPGRPNLLRVVIGDAPVPAPLRWREDELRVVDATVDDLDPRLWPGVLEDVVAAGALEAWLTPVLMRKGRPGHVVTALTPPGAVDAVFRSLVTGTTTLGVRVHGVERRALPRDSVEVDVEGRMVSVKRGFLDGNVTTVQPEFDDVRAAAHALGLPIEEVLRRVRRDLPDKPSRAD